VAAPRMSLMMEITFERLEKEKKEVEKEEKKEEVEMKGEGVSGGN
ncbi:uncharacterized, partial [Tachysurus ichikawai]